MVSSTSSLHDSLHTEETSERAHPNARADSSTTTAVRVYTSTSQLANDSYEKKRRIYARTWVGVQQYIGTNIGGIIMTVLISLL